MLLIEDLQKYTKKFKFWKFWERPLFNISEYAFKMPLLAQPQAHLAFVKKACCRIYPFGVCPGGWSVYHPSGVASMGARGAECLPWQWKNCKNWDKERENQEKIKKKRKNQEETAINGKFLSLCPSWQIGLATLLYHPCPPMKFFHSAQLGQLSL